LPGLSGEERDRRRRRRRKALASASAPGRRSDGEERGLCRWRGGPVYYCAAVLGLGDGGHCTVYCVEETVFWLVVGQPSSRTVNLINIPLIENKCP
jgi:hypothetical protein